MAYLLSFDPNKPLDLPEVDATETALFEAFWIGFKTMDLPKALGSEIVASMNLNRELKQHSIEGGSFDFAHCPGCGSRLGQYANRRTIEKALDLIVEKEEFDYLKVCFGRWERTFDELRPFFYLLNDWFSKAETKTPEQWRQALAARGRKAHAAD
jgi:hypothetical protein